MNDSLSENARDVPSQQHG